MVHTTPDTPLLTDERTKDVFFKLCMVRAEYPMFEFAELLRLWFRDDLARIAGFLEWLDAHGLEIGKKQNVQR